MKKFTWIFAALIAAGSAFATVAQGQGVYDGSNGGTLSNNLFQQYFTQGGANLTTAAMYPAPHPVPYKVGNVYYTYQPLMPHEMMWQHSRNYYNYYAPSNAFYSDPCTNCAAGGALNKTTVVWASNCTNHMGPLPLSISHLANAQYRFANRRYCLGGQYGCDCRRGNCGNGSCGYGYGGGCATGSCGGACGSTQPGTAAPAATTGQAR